MCSFVSARAAVSKVAAPPASAAGSESPAGLHSSALSGSVCGGLVVHRCAVVSRCCVAGGLLLTSDLSLFPVLICRRLGVSSDLFPVFKWVCLIPYC